jgi:hypothetical protein
MVLMTSLSLSVSSLSMTSDESVSRHDYHYRHEPILYGWKEGAAHFFGGGRAQDTVWEIPRPRRSETHPTMKPVELVARAVTNSSRPGDLVYEPGLDPSSPEDPDAFAARVEEFEADHVEPARVKALDEMGDGQRAMSVAMRWLGPKLG